MTHVMLPDGVLPWWLSAAGWLLAIALLAVATWRLRGVPVARTVPLVGVMTALMVIIMSIELVPIGYELHFTVLTGIVIGPWYGAIAAFIFNVLRALLGDGAFTNIGLNTIITWIEIALGAAIFAAFRPLARRWGPGLAAGAATFVALFVATLVFIGIVGLSTINPSDVIHTGAFDVEAGSFGDSPLAEGLVSVHVSEGQDADAGNAAARAGLSRFAVALMVLGLIGWTIEAVSVGAVAAFIARIRPDLLGLGPLSVVDPER